MGDFIKFIISSLLLITSISIAGCFGGFESKAPHQSLSSETPLIVDNFSGKVLYTNNCASCHGPIETSTKLGRNSEEIKNAISNISQMQFLRGTFSDNEISDISEALIPQVKTSPFDKACNTSTIKKSMPTARRLSRFEYFSAIEDLFGVSLSAVGGDFPYDLVSEGFNNQEDSLVVSRRHVSAFRDLAKLVSEQVNISTVVNQHTNCTQINNSCLNQFIDNLGLKVFRKPVDTDARNRLRDIGNFVASEGGNFNEATQNILFAMLQFPQFLYRLELNNNSSQLRDANGYEMASRLSFLIWQSTPDTTLLNLAASNQLRTDAQIQAQVKRLLQSSKARRGFRNYVRSWLGLDELGGFDISPGKYPLLNAQLLNDMESQIIKHYEELAFTDDRNLSEAITDEHAYLNDRLGEVYGLNLSGTNLIKRSTTSLQNRIGILSYPGLLMRPLASDHPSIVQRGKFINETFLCNHPPDPPANVPDDPILPEPGLSQRRSLDVHRSNVSCAACHSTIDGPGLAFETFNTIGQFRIRDDQNNALSTNGEWSLKGTDLNWNTTKQFVTSVGTSPVTQICMTEKVFQFGMGRELENEDKCASEEISKEIGLENATYKKIIEATALSESFRKSGGVEN